MLLGDVVDQLHDQDGLADAGAAEQPDLPALHEGLEEVDHFETGLEHLDLGALFFEAGSLAVDREGRPGFHLSHLVHGPSKDIEDAAQHLGAHRHRDRAAGVLGLHAADHSVGRLHGHAPRARFTEVLRHFGSDVHLHDALALRAAVDDGVVDGRELRLRRTRRRPRARSPESLDLPLPSDLLCVHDASAPLTTSMISLVMEACRTRFMFSVSESIISSAFLVAASMADIRAPNSAAADSYNARSTWNSTCLGSSTSNSACADGS